MRPAITITSRVSKLVLLLPPLLARPVRIKSSSTKGTVSRLKCVYEALVYISVAHCLYPGVVSQLEHMYGMCLCNASCKLYILGMVFVLEPITSTPGLQGVYLRGGISSYGSWQPSTQLLPSLPKASAQCQLNMNLRKKYAKKIRPPFHGLSQAGPIRTTVGDSSIFGGHPWMDSIFRPPSLPRPGQLA